MSALSLPDVRAGDHVLWSHVLPEVRQGFPTVQMPSVQREIKTERSKKLEEQRAANQCGGKVLPRRVKDEVPCPREAQNWPIHRGFTHRQ